MTQRNVGAAARESHGHTMCCAELRERLGSRKGRDLRAGPVLRNPKRYAWWYRLRGRLAVG
jgi:hypothetical protein